MKELERKPVTVGQAGNGFLWDHMAIVKRLDIDDEIIKDSKKDFLSSRRL
jgi:hypothetical protein